MRIFKIRPIGGGNYAAEKNFDNFMDYFDGSVIGDGYEVILAEMSEEEYNNLSEFDGF